MTYKKTVGSLSFVLAASVSSIAGAQGLGVAANLQAGRQTSVDAQAGFNPNASINDRSETAIGSDTKGPAGASPSGVTQAPGSSGKSSVGAGLDTAAGAQASARDTPIQIAKARKSGHAKTSTRTEVDLDASTALKAKNPR